MVVIVIHYVISSSKHAKQLAAIFTSKISRLSSIASLRVLQFCIYIFRDKCIHRSQWNSVNSLSK